MAHAIDQTIAAWQSTNHEIGMVAFFPTNSVTERFPYYRLPDDVTFIGTMEVDALCLASDGTLRIYDNAAPNRILCPVALNQNSFVSAMKELEQHFDKCAADAHGTYCDDLEAAAVVRDHCAKLAGGDVYLSFFTSMLGV